MADNGTPAVPETPAAPAAPSTPVEPGPAPAPQTPPATPALQFEGPRHKEATGQLTRTSQQLARYREMYGDLESNPSAPAPAEQPAPTSEAWTRTDQRNWELDQQIGRNPNLVPHAEEIKKLVGGGLDLQEARETVAKRHNIALAPSVQRDLELMPTIPGGGGMPPPNGANLDPEHEQSLAREAIPVEAAKKHLPKINQAWQKALRR